MATTLSPLVMTRRLQLLQRAIGTLQDGAANATFEGTTYTGSNLPALYQLVERLGVKAAIEQIENGAQSWMLGGTTYTRGDLRTLYAMDQDYEQRAVARARGGIPISYIRPG